MALLPQALLVLLLAGLASTESVEYDAVDDESSVLLLQMGVDVQRQNAVQPPAAADSQSARLEAALPLVYMHVPKTGSSIVNAFIRLPGVCPDFVAELGDDSFSGGRERNQFQVFQNNSLCEGLAPPPIPGKQRYASSRAWGIGHHEYVGDGIIFDEYYAGHGVTMLRQPEQRVISGLRHVSNRSEHSIETMLANRPVFEGCVVRMLSGGEPRFHGSNAEAACFTVREGHATPPDVPAEDVATAVARIRRFAFVGIQEEWHLSVCLLHAMFGGECHATEFMNTRPSPIGQASADLRQGNVDAVFEAPESYDTDILGGWVDNADRAVYAAGLEMFHAHCEEYNVTPESCRPCYETAGVL